MRRCASLLVIAAYQKVRLIPNDSRALPLELFTASSEKRRSPYNRQSDLLFASYSDLRAICVASAISSAVFTQSSNLISTPKIPTISSFWLMMGEETVMHKAPVIFEM